MADQWNRRTTSRLVGYQSWLHQTPCIDSSGDLFVSGSCANQPELPDMPSIRWVVALGDVCGKGEIRVRLKSALEVGTIRLAATISAPTLILKLLNDFIDSAQECTFATIMVPVINSDRHELTLANAGHNLPIVHLPIGGSRRGHHRLTPVGCSWADV